MNDNEDLHETKGFPPPASISVKTMLMAGLLVDVYGLDELPTESSSSSPSSIPIACLWLLHPRTRSRERMRRFACRMLHAYLQTPASSQRGLIALAFDMPNHGSRLVRRKANEDWAAGRD